MLRINKSISAVKIAANLRVRSLRITNICIWVNTQALCFCTADGY